MASFCWHYLSSSGNHKIFLNMFSTIYIVLFLSRSLFWELSWKIAHTLGFGIMIAWSSFCYILSLLVSFVYFVYFLWYLVGLQLMYRTNLWSITFPWPRGEISIWWQSCPASLYDKRILWECGVMALKQPKEYCSCTLHGILASFKYSIFLSKILFYIVFFS